MNHSPQARDFRIGLNLPPGWAPLSPALAPVRIPPREEGRVPFTVTVPEAAAGLHVVTADLGWGDWELREWTEMMVEVVAAIPERKD